MVEAGTARPAARRVHRVRLLHLLAGKQIRVGREQLQTGGHAGEGVSAGIRLLIDV